MESTPSAINRRKRAHAMRSPAGRPMREPSA
jgi:hypothetical protein